MIIERDVTIRFFRHDHPSNDCLVKRAGFTRTYRLTEASAGRLQHFLDRHGDIKPDLHFIYFTEIVFFCDKEVEEKPLCLKPLPNCKACHGSGEVSDSVPYGMGNTSMDSFCDCVLEQIPEGEDDREIELDLSDYREEN